MKRMAMCALKSSAAGKVVLVLAAAAARRHRMASAAVPVAAVAAVPVVRAAAAMLMIIGFADTVESVEKVFLMAESETLPRIQLLLTRPAARAAPAVTWAPKVAMVSSS